MNKSNQSIMSWSIVGFFTFIINMVTQDMKALNELMFDEYRYALKVGYYDPV